MALRLTNIDKANILKAKSIKIVNLNGEREQPLFIIRLNDTLDISVPYVSLKNARRAVRRIRNDIEPTTL